MLDNQLKDAARVTGYWTEGIIRGTLFAAPPLMVLSILIGSTLWLVRRGTRLGGLE
mgnify:CR=1 FL=1